MILHTTKTTVSKPVEYNNKKQAKIQITSSSFVPVAGKPKLEVLVVLFEPGEQVNILKIKDFIQAQIAQEVQDADAGIPFMFKCASCGREVGTTQKEPVCCGFHMIKEK